MRALILTCVVGSVFAMGCSGKNEGNGFPVTGGSSSGGGSSGGGGGSSGGGSSGGGLEASDSGALENSDAGGTSNGCASSASDFVYVLTVENDLYKFAPAAKTFTLVGNVGCAPSMQANSMAVDRNANAYVNYISTDGLGSPTAGAIYKVSTTDASCQGQVMALPSNYYQVGMGYSTNGTSSTDETLFVSGISSSSTGIGTVDLTAGTVTTVGAFNGTMAGLNAELTGTGSGLLYGFFTPLDLGFGSNGVYVTEINKSTGATPSPVPMTGVQPPTDWAFSFWGGHFYLYTSQGSGSSVTDYDPVGGTIDTSYITSLSFDIVGAGVSTCAPVVPPPTQ